MTEIINHSHFLIEYRREEAERKDRATFREQIINGMTEEKKKADKPLPTKKFNGNSYQFCYFASYKKDARKRANELNNKGYATKISKRKNNPNKQGKPFFIVWKR